MQSKNLIFVVYDSISNSIFSGQVIQPLLKRLQEEQNLKIFLISFEKNKIPEEIISKYSSVHANLNLIIFKRFPFLGKITLYLSARKFKKFISKLDNYEIINRSPLAGWISMKIIDPNKCKSFTVQARGLLAEEHRFSHPKSKNLLRNLFNSWRANQLEKIEKESFNPKIKLKNFYIESVSTALKEYLINKFEADENYIKIASFDIPKKIPENQIKEWRKEIRQYLNKSENIHIYCYSGAVRAWQCPDMVINFFEQKLKRNKNIFLLVLTQDICEFEKIAKNKIDSEHYKILSVKHEEIYKYLSACDTGLIFRKNHIVSWVARPVKAMEYQSVGMNIIHNGTTKWLLESNYNKTHADN